MLTEAQYRSFAELGLIKVAGLIPEAAVSPARDLVYERLRRSDFWLEENQAWVRPTDSVAARKRLGLKGRAEASLFKRLLTPEVLGAARELVNGQEVRPTAPHTQFLFTPPGAAEWHVPRRTWHIDVPRLADLAPGVQMFTFLDTVAPGGGGTLVAAGSHRLLNDVGALSSKEVKKRLRREPYFRELMGKTSTDRSRFMTAVGHVGDVPLRVVELTGEPGDVYFTDLRLLHTLGPNASSVPRLMVTQRLPLESFIEAAAR